MHVRDQYHSLEKRAAYMEQREDTMAKGQNGVDKKGYG
jgi:hypothetical protein